MADSFNTPGPDGVPTLEEFSNLPYPRYYRDVCDVELYAKFEHLEDYEPGGFCPIDVSFEDEPSFINDRFQVIYKLGWGGFGTVWLCYEAAVKKWRAVKVGRASQTEEHRGECLLESVMEQHSVGVAEALENSIALPLETFWIESINGKHLCTVLPLLGPRLSDWVGWLKRDDPDQAQRIVSQMTKGMDFLHRHGICHGDFRPQNMLMQLKDGAFDDIGMEEMREEILGALQMADILLWNGNESPCSPKRAYSSVYWKSLSRFVSDKIAIVDFGEAYLTTNPNPRELGIPGPYAAPEVVFGGEKGIATDIWALARSILEFRPQLIIPRGSDTYDKIWEMEGFAGPCPPPFRWSAQQRLLGDLLEADTEEGQDEKETELSENSQTTGSASAPEMVYLIDRSERGPAKDYDHPVEQFLGMRLHLQLDREEILSLGDLLRNMFRWQPEERWNMDRILAHRWFSEKHQPGISRKYVSTYDNELETEISEGHDDVVTGLSDRENATGSIINPSESSSDAQQALPRQKTTRTYLKLLEVAFYLLGVLATIVFFLAHMLANQPAFYAERQMISSHEPTSLVSTVVEYVIVIFILQE